MPCGCHGRDRGHGPLLQMLIRNRGRPMGAIAGTARSYRSSTSKSSSASPPALFSSISTFCSASLSAV